MGKFPFCSLKEKFYTLKIEVAYVCENLNKGFSLYIESYLRNFYSRRREKPSIVGCHIYSDIFFIIFQMSSQNTRRISYNKNEEACMLDTVTLSFMNWRFLYTVINFVFFAARCFSSPDWLPGIRQCDVSIYVLRILSRWAVKGPHMTLRTSHTPLNPLIYSPLYQHINLLSILIKISHFINLLISVFIKDFIS